MDLLGTDGVDVVGTEGVDDVDVAEAPAPEPCRDDVCITCSDEAQMAEVTAVAGDGQAEVLVGGRRETVDASLVEAAPGDFVLVHAGVAISVLGPRPAVGAIGRPRP